jgi:hypothetical protein
MKIKLKKLLKNQNFLILWCFVAAFGTYFCMYAFRKPFNTGLYEGLEIFGISYKTVLILTQVFGYMVSKFLGIKIISELRPKYRILLIISLIVFSEIALLFFGLVPFPYNWVFLFLNGLPLGMVWGVIFSFLEGRRITEFISVGLSINLIVGSGILKTIYLIIKDLTHLSEFWMPVFVGFVFLPFFLFFVWMLSKIPEPTPQDIQSRSIRKAMHRADKQKILKEFGLGFYGIVLIYVMLTTIRDFRDNFSIEIWKNLGVEFNKNTFAQTELMIGFVVLLLLISVGFIKNNQRAFVYIHTLMLVGILSCGICTWLFQGGKFTANAWMILLGISLFLPYLLVQTLYFERFIALFKLNANAGFFVYICDSLGYLGSVFLLVYKEFFMQDLSWVNVLINLSYFIFGFSLLLWVISVWFYFKRKMKIIIQKTTLPSTN